MKRMQRKDKMIIKIEIECIKFEKIVINLSQNKTGQEQKRQGKRDTNIKEYNKI